jgi:hypothetical protein
MNDPMVFVRELAYGYYFCVPNSVLSKIVRNLNAKLDGVGFISGRTYKSIINEELNGYKLPANEVDDVFGFQAFRDGRDTFEAHVMWVTSGSEAEEPMAIGELTFRDLAEPLL